MTLPDEIRDREFQKFVLDPEGDVAIKIHGDVTIGDTGVDVVNDGINDCLMVKQNTAPMTEVHGTVTANAGTGFNVDTSLLALESGGNLASVKISTDNLPAILTELQNKTEPSDVQLGEIIVALRYLLAAIANPPYVDKTLNRMRATDIIESGTVTTVTTVTGLTNIDSYQGKMLMIGGNINAWANVVRRTIT
jgi:hypothetical protein